MISNIEVINLPAYRAALSSITKQTADDLNEDGVQHISKLLYTWQHTLYSPQDKEKQQPLFVLAELIAVIHKEYFTPESFNPEWSTWLETLTPEHPYYWEVILSLITVFGATANILLMDVETSTNIGEVLEGLKSFSSVLEASIIREYDDENREELQEQISSISKAALLYLETFTTDEHHIIRIQYITNLLCTKLGLDHLYAINTPPSSPKIFQPENPEAAAVTCFL